MSVPKGQQSDGKLLVNELARDLAVYTIRITSNPKVFLPQFQTALTNEIIHCATNIHKYAWTANNVMVRGQDGREKYAARRKYQEMAASECNNLIKRLRGQYKGDAGYNPGSQMVQIAGISVLDPVDHFAKEQLRCKYYLRYMDDILFISPDRAYLEDCKQRIEELLHEMGFEYNQKKTRIYRLSEGIDFLGFTFRMTDSGKVLRLISAKNVKMQRKKLVRLVALCKSGKYPKSIADDSYRCWRAHAAKGNTWKLLARMDKFYSDLWRVEHEKHF